MASRAASKAEEWARAQEPLESAYSRIALEASRLKIRKPPRYRGKKRRLTVCGSDIHGIKRDKGAWSIFLQAIRDLRPDGIYLLGDIMDGQSVNRHTLAASDDPSVTLRMEFTDVNHMLNEVDDAAIYAWDRLVADGNHDEEREAKWLRQACPPQLRDMIPSLWDAVRAKDRGYRVFYGHEQPIRVGNLLLLHGHFFNKFHSAAHLMALGDSCLYGHTHTPQQFTTKMNDRHIQATGMPCLRVLNREWEHQSRVHTWTNGFAVIEWVDGVKAFPRNVYIVDGVATYAGHVWRAK